MNSMIFLSSSLWGSQPPSLCLGLPLFLHRRRSHCRGISWARIGCDQLWRWDRGTIRNFLAWLRNNRGFNFFHLFFLFKRGRHFTSQTDSCVLQVSFSFVLLLKKYFYLIPWMLEDFYEPFKNLGALLFSIFSFIFNLVIFFVIWYFWRHSSLNGWDVSDLTFGISLNTMLVVFHNFGIKGKLVLTL